MLVPQFKFKRCHDGEFNWTAESDYENLGRHRSFFAIGRTLSDVKRFADIVRRLERTGKIEDLGSQLVPLEEETGIQTTWGGTL
jgi:hypothetical protein